MELEFLNTKNKKMNTGNKHFAFMYFIYRIIETYATRISRDRNTNDSDQLYQRLKIFVGPHNETNLSKDICLALPLVFAMNSPHRTALIKFWQTLKPLHDKRMFIVEDVQRYLDSSGNSFNKLFSFQRNTIFLNEDFHVYSRHKKEIRYKQLMKFLEFNEEDIDSSIYPILGLIDESIQQVADHEDFFIMVLQPEQYLRKFAKVKIVHKSAMQFFDDQGTLLGRYKEKAVEIIYKYICQSFEKGIHEKILLPSLV